MINQSSLSSIVRPRLGARQAIVAILLIGLLVIAAAGTESVPQRGSVWLDRRINSPGLKNYYWSHEATRYRAVVLTPFQQRSESSQSSERPTGVLRLRVRVKMDDASPLKGLARKRFFLIRGSLEQNVAVVHAIEQNTLMSRDCYYSKLGASEQLIAWLKSGDCESIYCRAVEPDFVTGPKAVPEFTQAFDMGQKEFGNDETALRWISTKVPANLRDGFYQSRQAFLQSILKQAQASADTQVRSVMTDSNGTAYFTDLEPGAYVLSSIVPTELGANSVVWNCEVQVKTGDLATEKPYLVSNRKDKNVKCVAIERPLPGCEK